MAVVVGGCGDPEPVKKPPRYQNIGLRPVPEYMRGSIFEMADVSNTEVYPVSGYGLVVNLSGTGGSAGIPGSVRDYMLDEMTRHGFGQATSDDFYRKLKPERVLDDPLKRTAVVTVVGLIPPGARKTQPMDLIVQALPDSEVTNLARGVLYRTSLRVGGANPYAPRGAVNIYAVGEGDLFVNPIHLMVDNSEQLTGTAKASLRTATVLGRAVVTEDRPLVLRIRTPEFRLAMAIQERIRLAFPKTDEDPMLKAQGVDEGQVMVLVPLTWTGDWEHFIGVVTHLYLDATAEFSAMKAAELARIAVQPGVPLMDISYAWEGMGKPALPYIQPLYAHGAADVAYAAARAGAFIGDNAAQQMLLRIAASEGHPFQLSAVKALGSLPQSPRIERMLGQLLDLDNLLVRLEAYRILTRYRDQSRLYTEKVGRAFVLDVVPSNGPPLIYASRVGQPRIAIFGKNTAMKVPIMFTALDSTLTISSDDASPRLIKVFYRGRDVRQPVSARLGEPSLRELVWRLGGGSDDGFRFSYADVVGVLHRLSARKDVAGAFVLQDMPRIRTTIDDAPVIPDRGAAGGTTPASGGVPAIGIR